MLCSMTDLPEGIVYIGAPGFEPGTSPTRTVRATRLRHAPKGLESSRSPGASRARPAGSSRSAGHRAVVAHGESCDERLEGLVDAQALVCRVALDSRPLDRLGLLDDVVD